MARKAIDFFIIGAPKAGSTALYRHLGGHPDIYVPRLKEMHYFTRDEFYGQGEGYIEAFYRDRSGERVAGGADVDLMACGARCARRLREHNREMRAIAMLRNPIDRAHSAYWFARRQGWEDAETFEAALERDAARAAGRATGRTSGAPIGYLERGRYAEGLRPYLDELGRDRVYAVISEDLFDDPAATLRPLLEWLGVAPDVSAIDLAPRVNPSGMPRSMTVQKILRSGDSWPKRALRGVLPPGLRYRLRSRVLGPLMSRNVRPFRYPPMRPDTRARLAEHFDPHNRELADLMGLPLDRWR